MKMKTLLAGMGVVLGLSASAQTFNRVLYSTGVDHNHYSNETTNGGEYVFAGTQFLPGNNNIHIAVTIV